MIGRKKAPLLALAAAGALALGACVGDGDELVTRTTPVIGGALFDRYVALGNSITAGFQSGGINKTTQLQAYPVLLASRAGASFGVPLLANPGCPAPFLAPLGATGRLGGASATACALRVTHPDSLPRVVQNLAVPGARVADLLQIPAGSLQLLNTFVVGNRSQLQAMQALDPTLVSAWIGNNDALAAALGGNLGPSAAGADSTLTRLSVFHGQLAEVVDGIEAAAPQDAILIGVVDAVTAAPLIQPGAYFFAAASLSGGEFNGKPVNPNCSPMTDLGQPNPLAANMVSFQIVGDPNFLEISCDPNAYPVGDPRRGVYLLDVAEQAVVRTRVAQYNAAIAAAAQANGWIYLDPNALLLPHLQQGPPFNQIRKCQMLATAATPAQFQAAVLQSCPGPQAPGFFGNLISLDGVHPSAAAHVIIANELARLINAKHGTSLRTS